MKTPYLFLILFLYSISFFGQDTYSDTFSSVSYSNNNGNTNFATNWIESNDDNSASNGRIRITGNELRFHRLTSHNIRRTANLSTATGAVLTFNWRTSSLESGETLAIQASSDGTTFTTLTTITGSTTGNFNQDISTYISANTTIRFIKGGGNWNASNDRAYIDNFIITATTAPDSDGDGIFDDVDLDDDNDGMTDEEEYCTTANTTFLLSQDVGTRTVVLNHTDSGYLRLDFSSMDNSFQLDINGTTVHPSILEFENGALGAGEEYFRFQSDNAFISSPWVANSNGLPRLRLIIDETGSVSFYGTRTSSSTTLEIMQAEAGTPFNTITWVPGANNVFTVTNQSGPGPEGFTGVLFVSALCDTDGDGVLNSLDLDSDNDGIYDIVEAGVLNESGVNDANNDGIIDGVASTFGNNGLFSSIENNDMPYADLTYTIRDSDTDGIYDPYELDADNDSCNDVTESGFTDNNSDGILATLPTTVSSTGLVTGTSVIDGYTAPDDNNTNGIYDFQEASAAPSISTQPSGPVICPGCSTAISVVATDVSGYQWQLFNGVSWVDLTDTGIHSGTTTGTLVLANTGPSDNGNQYRVVLTNAAFVCDTTTSITATLTYQVNTIISNRRITYRVNKN
ncbi:immunoglobulin domain-containing protein [Maribacter sp. HTCC2170]|uniref:immunoglobulin domain-containing protein n=1 Tax=Maribacter sp. (strain HTCC2170 / KCCM 42371) TaxID=313603 RepID=UPI00006AFDC8|nr:immunoglobulin domain-containing protein [Maribacter sp. HTCC2170]EAR01270.1 hypothetical protein FB2170_11136 [Maribacter sp. HTCC2170]